MQRQQTRAARVVDYIQRHLDEDLSTTQISRVAKVSRFHFHRQFAAVTGVNLAVLTRLLRLKQASFRLIFETRPSVMAVAFDAGFASPEAFTRAFRRTFGQSPREFRAHPAWRVWRDKYRFMQRYGASAMNVEIIDFPTTRVAALEHRGSPDDVYNTTRSFVEWRRANGMPPSKGATYGVHHTDQAVKPEDYRIDLCVSYDAPVAPNPQGVVVKVIPGGRCARVRHIGSREHIESADYLFRQWLPASGEQRRDFPPFFHYVNVGPGVADHEMITDVYLPLL